MSGIEGEQDSTRGAKDVYTSSREYVRAGGQQQQLRQTLMRLTPTPSWQRQRRETGQTPVTPLACLILPLLLSSQPCCCTSSPTGYGGTAHIRGRHSQATLISRQPCESSVLSFVVDARCEHCPLASSSSLRLRHTPYDDSPANYDPIRHHWT
jgi:hypothetical protein